jgi:hypothetical protein
MRVIAQIPQVKMRFPELDINGRGDWRDDLCLRKSDPKRAEQRPDHGAVTRRLHAILPRCRVILSFDEAMTLPPSSSHLFTSVDGTAPP